jgi:hypothetical protein
MKAALQVLVALGVLLGFFAQPPPVHVAAQAGQRIILMQGGTFTLTFFRPGDISCSGDLWMDLPTPRRLLSNYRYGQPAPIQLGPYPAGTELRFYIQPDGFCARDENGSPFAVRYYSDGTSNDPDPRYQSHARLNALAALDSYRVDFEDLPTWYDDGKGPDFDFNDLSIILRKDGAHPDYRQDAPDWSGEPYAQTGGSIGALGSALTSAANVANFHGGVVDPLSLNQCLMQPNVAGYVRPADDVNNCPGPNCMAGAIRWTRIEACLNPLDPNESPLLMRFRGKFSLGQIIIDPKSGLRTEVTRATLKQMIDADLAKSWPVILEVRAPGAPGGVHYVMADAKAGGSYSIVDPLCGNWPSCSSAKTTLAGYNDDLLSIVRFQPGDGVAHTSIIVNAFHPLAHFYVRDPLGRKLGYSAETLMTFVEIPEGGYFYQPPLADMQTNALLGSGMNELYIIDPVEGEYRLFVSGVQGQEYNIVFQYHDNQQAPGQDEATTPDTQSQVISGSLEEETQIRLELEVTPGQPPVVSAPPVIRHRYVPLVVRR